MKLTIGSITSLTVDHGWIAEFTSGGETWTEPVIGWAVVVRWANHGGENAETDLQAVVLAEDRYPVAIREYVDDVPGPNTPTVRLIQQEATR